MLNSHTITIEAEVTGISAGRIDAVVEALSRATPWEIPPEGWWTEEHSVSIESEAILRPGERPGAFAQRFARSTWEANTGYCPVSLAIERPGGSPGEDFVFGELDYRRMTGEVEDAPRPAAPRRKSFRTGAGVPKPVPLKHFGGKALLAPWITGLLPEGQGYAEPYAGGAAVLFNRPRAGREWLNDLDPEIMRFYENLQDPASFATLRNVADDACSELARLWAPEDLDGYNALVKVSYRDLKDRYVAERDPSVAAGLFFVLKKIGRNGETSSVVTSTRYRRSMPESFSALLTACEELPAFHERLRGIRLSRRDALGLIDEIDEEGVVLYLDPPYLHATRRTTHNYGVREMSGADHEALLRRLLGCRCSVAISGYPSDLYDGYLTGAAGWERHAKEVRCSSSNHCGDTRRTEVLWVKR